ncbi:hypothetical protein ACOSQ2_009802 [Xanthoceras sorbifolium]
MASLNDLMILTTLFLSLSLNSASPSVSPNPKKFPTNNLLETTCKKTGEFYTLCMEILESNPETSSAASNSLDLAEATLKFVAVETQIASKKLRVLLKRKITQHGLSKAFEICVDWYDRAAGQLNTSSKELKEDPASANYDAALALADSHESADCENALASAGVHVPEIEAMIKRLRCLCTIAHAVTVALPQEY